MCKWEMCEGCAYDGHFDDGGCEVFTDRPFMCDRYVTLSEKLATERAIKEHNENQMFKKGTYYRAFSGACGKYCQNT
jgi:hypothetical protein